MIWFGLDDLGPWSKTTLPFEWEKVSFKGVWNLLGCLIDLFGALWTQKLNFMVKILEPFHFSLKFWSSNKSKVLSLITVFNFRLHSVIQTLFCMVSLNVKGINSTGHFWRCSTKKIVQLDSHCHHPSFCPLIPKLCSVKSQHWP